LLVQKFALLIPILVFASIKNIAGRLEGLGANIKWSDSERFLRIVEQFMKGAIHEETFSTNFLGDNTGNWCPIRSCPWHKNTSQDVRTDLFHSRRQLSEWLFLSNQWR
jgi:hypothetical protein